MPLYTLEANQTPILVLSASDAHEARAICDDAKEELQEFDTVGEDQETTIRDADEEERAYWDAAITVAVEEGDLDNRAQAEKENHMVLLVPLAHAEADDDAPDDEA